MNKVYAILLWFALLFCHNGLLAQNGGVIVTGKVYAEDEPEGFIGATVIEQDKNGRIYFTYINRCCYCRNDMRRICNDNRTRYKSS